jgi:hypothetical protein
MTRPPAAFNRWQQKPPLRSLESDVGIPAEQSRCAGHAPDDATVCWQGVPPGAAPWIGSRSGKAEALLLVQSGSRRTVPHRSPQTNLSQSLRRAYDTAETRLSKPCSDALIHGTSTAHGRLPEITAGIGGFFAQDTPARRHRVIAQPIG